MTTSRTQKNVSLHEQPEAAESLDRYLHIVIRIADRLLLQADGAEETERLTGHTPPGTVEVDRSNITNQDTSNV